MSDTSDRGGCVLPALWLGAAFLGLLLCGALVGWAGYQSESTGMRAAMVVAFPLGFVWSGALAAMAGYFKPSDKVLVRHGVPLGCGCFGAMAMALVVIVFFGAIWPAL